MKIRSKLWKGYQGRGIAIPAGAVVELGEEEAQRLLLKFPDWFEAVGGQDTGADSAKAPSTSEKSLPAAPRKKPYRGKGK